MARCPQQRAHMHNGKLYNVRTNLNAKQNAWSARKLADVKRISDYRALLSPDLDPEWGGGSLGESMWNRLIAFEHDDLMYENKLRVYNRHLKIYNKNKDNDKTEEHAKLLRSHAVMLVLEKARRLSLWAVKVEQVRLVRLYKDIAMIEMEKCGEYEVKPEHKYGVDRAFARAEHVQAYLKYYLGCNLTSRVFDELTAITKKP